MKYKELINELVFDKNGLIPVIVQDINNNVIMLAYMNKEALSLTLETKKLWFYSRSRRRLWQKGESSGNYQILKEIYHDCDKDALLVKVEQVGVACHTGNYSCFFNQINVS